MPNLILKRRALQTIVIGDARVTVVRVFPNGDVHLAVDAPEDIPVNREETYHRKVASGALPRRAGGEAA